jgi:uroporphyrinogen-III synthase
LFTVGAGTAEEARRMGFARIVKGPGTAADLVPLIASLVDAADDMLLHLAGEQLAFDLAGELGTVGVRVETRTVYRMDAAAALPAPVVRAIAAGAIDAVMLMSPRAASIWSRLALRHDLVGALRQVLHLCISDAVAGRLAALGPSVVDVARRPTLEEMLALVDRAAARWPD